MFLYIIAFLLLLLTVAHFATTDRPKGIAVVFFACWWVTVVWAIAVPTFNRLHLLWLMPAAIPVGLGVGLLIGALTVGAAIQSCPPDERKEFPSRFADRFPAGALITATALYLAILRFL